MEREGLLPPFPPSPVDRIITLCGDIAYIRVRSQDDVRLASVEPRLRRQGPPVAPKTQSASRSRTQLAISLVDPRDAALMSSTSSSLEDLSASARQPLSSVTRQLVRDLEQRQMQLRQRGILAAGETVDGSSSGVVDGHSLCGTPRV